MATTLPQNFVAQAFLGLAYPLQALGYISKNKLWKHAVWAVLINVILLAGLLVLAFALAVPGLNSLEGSMRNWAADSTLWAGVVWLLVVVMWSVGVTLLVAGSSIALLLVGQAVASPFLDILSEQVEHLELGTQELPISTKRMLLAIAVSLSDLVWGLVYLVAINLPIWLLTFYFPPPATVLTFVSSALLLAHEFIGLSLTRYFVNYRARWGAVWRNKWFALGFGTSSMALLVVPGLNLVLLPLAAVGGTLLYCDLVRAGRITLPEDEVAARKLRLTS